MTIIAGFQCTDGILMCSDTEQFISPESKSQVGKIPVVQLAHFTAAIGGAGDGALIEYLTQDLCKHLVHWPRDWDALESGLNDYGRKAFTKHIRAYAGFPSVDIPTVSFLIAVTMNEDARLFRWERNFVHAVPKWQHTSIGVGTLQSEQLLSEMQFAYPSQQMFFFAVRMMQKVKQIVQGCGGKTEVVFLPSTGNSFTRPGTFITDEIEHMAGIVDDFLTNHILSFIANTEKMDQQTVDAKLDLLRKGIMNLREKNRTLKPGIWS